VSVLARRSPWRRRRREPAFAAAEVSPPPPSTDPGNEAGGPGEWNLWELERRARDYAGGSPVREDWRAMFIHLRDFASSDGSLPGRFDPLVRESFPELTHP
jgi:hypothetical protein